MPPKTERFELRLEEEILTKIDKWRSEQDKVLPRAEAVRRLVELGLGKDERPNVGDRLIIWMLGEITKELRIADRAETEFINEALSGGHFWALKRKLSGLFDGQDYQDKPQDVIFVTDVLEMWDFIEGAYEVLTQEDQARISRETDQHTFLGFDGTYEAPLLSIARFMVKKMDYYSRFKEKGFNSHVPMASHYRKMLHVFQPMRKTLMGRELNTEEVIAIFKTAK